MDGFAWKSKKRPGRSSGLWGKGFGSAVPLVKARESQGFFKYRLQKGLWPVLKLEADVVPINAGRESLLLAARGAGTEQTAWQLPQSGS